MNDGRRPNTRLRPACGAASTKPIRPKQLDDAAPRWLRAVGDQPGVAGSPDEPRAGTPISASPPRLFGRHAETTALDALLDQARAGIGDALVLWGEPGIGKTALVQHVHHRAGEFVRLSHRAARAESELDFAGLHGLLRPVSKHFESLAAPQAAALRSAAGSSSEPTNPLVVGAAVLSLLCRLADKRPVLVTVDDGQWLDDATARCLGIVARRLHPHPVVIVLADQHDPAARRWEGLPELRVDGLTDASARQLLAAVAAPTDEVAVADMVAKAGGNPLALRESAGICESAEDDEHRIRGRTPIGPRMRRAFRAALDALSAPAQLLIVLAAAECDGDRRTVQRAGRALGAHDAWDEAIDTGLLQVGTTRSNSATRSCAEPCMRAVAPRYDVGCTGHWPRRCRTSPHTTPGTSPRSPTTATSRSRPCSNGPRPTPCFAEPPRLRLASCGGPPNSRPYPSTCRNGSPMRREPPGTPGGRRSRNDCSTTRNGWPPATTSPAAAEVCADSWRSPGDDRIAPTTI